MPASSVRANWASSRRIVLQDPVALVVQVRVGIAHDLDDDRGERREEWFVASEKATVAHRAPHDAAQHVAAPLVARQDAVGDEERDRPGVVRDDLVAEALGLEDARDRARGGPAGVAWIGVKRSVSKFPGTCWRTLANRSRLMPVSTLWNGSGTRPPGRWSYSMKTRFQISSQRGQFSEWSGTHSGPSERWAPRSKWISLHGPHGPVSAIRQKLLSSPESTSPQIAILSGGRPISSRQTARAISSSLYVVAARRSAGIPRSPVRNSQAKWMASRLEVVAEAPVAEHLEEGVVAGGPAHLFEVVVLARDAEDALIVDRTAVGACLRPGEDVLELDHPRVREEERLVAGRDERRAGDRPRARGRRRTRRSGDGSPRWTGA